MRPTAPGRPGTASSSERAVAVDYEQVRENHRRLAELDRTAPHVSVFSAHDPQELARSVATQQT